MYAAANRLLRGAKKSTTRSSRNKQSSLPAISPAMVAIAAAVLVAFIGGLYFITHHKKEEAEAMQNRQAAGNGLPPKPEERWRYIKELESRQPGVRAPTEPTAGGEVMKPEQLTDEQRQLLAQMQADMRQQPTQLTEVPWNEQTPAQRQQTLQRQRLAQQQQQAQQQQWAQTQAQTVQQQPPRVSAAEAGSAATAEADRVKPAAVPGSAADASAYQYHAAAYPGRGAGNSGGRSAENHRREERRS